MSDVSFSSQSYSFLTPVPEVMEHSVVMEHHIVCYYFVVIHVVVVYTFSCRIFSFSGPL